MQSDDSKEIKIKGKMTFNFTAEETFDIGDVDGHILSLRKAEGKNINIGKPEFMDGANAVNVSFDDLVKGNGPHQGYSTLTKNSDSIVTKWEGKIITILTSAGIPIPSFEGTMEWIKATGQYEGMQGKGHYKGHFSSETSYDVEWEGEYWHKRQ